MNLITLLTAALGVAQAVAPKLPDLVADAETFGSDITKVVSDISRKDAGATIADVEAAFAHVGTDIATVVQVVNASKSIAA